MFLFCIFFRRVECLSFRYDFYLFKYSSRTPGFTYSSLVSNSIHFNIFRPSALPYHNNIIVTIDVHSCNNVRPLWPHTGTKSPSRPGIYISDKILPEMLLWMIFVLGNTLSYPIKRINIYAFSSCT